MGGGGWGVGGVDSTRAWSRSERIMASNSETVTIERGAIDYYISKEGGKERERLVSLARNVSDGVRRKHGADAARERR